MTTAMSKQFKLTLEQRQKLGRVYLLILTWRQERERKKAQKDETGLQNAFRDSGSASANQSSFIESEA